MIMSASCRHPSCLGKKEKRGNAGWMEETFGVLPQAGSLAAALGMFVDPSSKAPPIRDHNEKAAPAAAPKKRGLFDAVLKIIAAMDDASLSSSSDSDESEPFKDSACFPKPVRWPLFLEWLSTRPLRLFRFVTPTRRRHQLQHRRREVLSMQY